MQTMPEDPADEIADLAAQISEQLAFFREIGITDIGGTIRPPWSSSNGSALESASSASITRAIEQTIGIQDQDVTGLVKGGTAAEQAQPNPLQVNLFGEVVSPTEGRSVRTKTSTAETSSIAESWSDRSLEEIRNDIGECTRCRLHEHRT